jgi:hypothetical protein
VPGGRTAETPGWFNKRLLENAMNVLVKNSVIAAAAFAALGSFSSARADVMSSAVVRLSNLVFYQAGTNNPLDFADFSTITATSTGSIGGTLNPGGGSYNLSTTVDGITSPNTPINLAPQCLGGACPVVVDNAFPKLAPPPNPGNYLSSDQNESGVPITGIPGNTQTLGAVIENGAWIGFTSGAVDGNATSTNTLTSIFEFTLNNNTAIDFRFLVNAFLLSSVTADEAVGTTTSATYNINFTITDLETGSVIFNVNPDVFFPVYGAGTCPTGECPKTISRNGGIGFGTTTFDTGGFIGPVSAVTPALLADNRYQLTASTSVVVNAVRQQVVPEPTSLGLLGAGLLAFFAASRRRRQA